MIGIIKSRLSSGGIHPHLLLISLSSRALVELHCTLLTNEIHIAHHFTCIECTLFDQHRLFVSTKCCILSSIPLIHFMRDNLDSLHSYPDITLIWAWTTPKYCNTSPSSWHISSLSCWHPNSKFYPCSHIAAIIDAFHRPMQSQTHKIEFHPSVAPPPRWVLHYVSRQVLLLLRRRVRERHWKKCLWWNIITYSFPGSKNEC